ncbi:hypothetical protein HY970_00390 [Candidatus Kaiserbacteria bacterium]|nr:hypothetical protein [Candidatus Kaiserbacteria bacterium]
MGPKIIDLRNKKPSRRRVHHARSVFAGERRSSPLRARRRKVRFAILGALLIMLAAIAYGVHWTASIPQMRITHLRVEGAHQVSESEVSDHVRTMLAVNSWRYIPQDNIFFYPKREIEESLVTSLPRLQSATLRRASFLSTELEVSIKERESYALWCQQEIRCFDMDEGGFVFAAAASTAAHPSTTYIFSGGISSENPIGQGVAPDHMDGIVALLKRLEETGYRAREIRIENEQDFSITLERGYILKASYGAEINNLVRDLGLVLNSEALRGTEGDLEYIDLRFGNRVYYKFKGSVESSTR